MKCPICSKQTKKFVFEKPKEKLFQCSNCNFNFRLTFKKIEISISGEKYIFDYLERNYNKKKLKEKLKEIQVSINLLRDLSGKNKIKYKPILKKRCSECGKIKFINRFYNARNKIKRSACKKCTRKEYKKKYYKYNNLIKNKYYGINKKQEEQFDVRLSFSLEEFKKWLEENNYKTFYKTSMINVSDKKYKICILRKNFNKGYYLDNMEIVFQKDIPKKIHLGKISQKKFQKPVVQMKDGRIVKIWNSASKAARSVEKFTQPGINLACNGKRKIHAGYEWKYF